MDETLKAIYDGVVEGDNGSVQKKVQEALGRRRERVREF